MTDFREATCRQYEENTCTRGGYCNFMHLRPISKCAALRAAADTLLAWDAGAFITWSTQECLLMQSKNPHHGVMLMGGSTPAGSLKLPRLEAMAGLWSGYIREKLQELVAQQPQLHTPSLPCPATSHHTLFCFDSPPPPTQPATCLALVPGGASVCCS